MTIFNYGTEVFLDCEMKDKTFNSGMSDADSNGAIGQGFVEQDLSHGSHSRRI